MARRTAEGAPTASAVDWLTRDQEIVEGLDHLGVQVVSANIYAQLVPGVSNVTDRARYFSFHPWVLHSFARDATDRSPSGWRRWIRRLEYTYSVASVAAEHAKNSAIHKDAVGGMIGINKARAATRGLEVDIDTATRLEANKAVTGHYFKNPQGGYAQYYKGSLTVLGILRHHEGHKDPDRQLTTYAGVKLAEAVEHIQAFRDLRTLARTEEKIATSELAALGRVVHPGAINRDSEEAQLLRGLLLGDDDELCAGQPAAIRVQRRQSLALVLHYISHGDLDRRTYELGFRWCVLASQTTSGADSRTSIGGGARQGAGAHSRGRSSARVRLSSHRRGPGRAGDADPLPRGGGRADPPHVDGAVLAGKTPEFVCRARGPDAVRSSRGRTRRRE